MRDPLFRLRGGTIAFSPTYNGKEEFMVGLPSDFSPSDLEFTNHDRRGRTVRHSYVTIASVNSVGRHDGFRDVPGRVKIDR